jgi:hypothetical protein
MKAIKIKFQEKSLDFIVRRGYSGKGFYMIEGYEKNGLYYVRASTNYKYVASLSLHRKCGDKFQKGKLML